MNIIITIAYILLLIYFGIKMISAFIMLIVPSTKFEILTKDYKTLIKHGKFSYVSGLIEHIIFILCVNLLYWCK